MKCPICGKPIFLSQQVSKVELPPDIVSTPKLMPFLPFMLDMPGEEILVHENCLDKTKEKNPSSGGVS